MSKPKPRSDSQPRVLLVEDDATLARAFLDECARQRLDLPVEWTDDAARALAWLKDIRGGGGNGRRYLVVVGLSGPGTIGAGGAEGEGDPFPTRAGWRFLAAIGADPGLISIPVVVLADADVEPLDRMRRLGVFARVDRAQLPMAVARVSMLAGHLWPAAAAELVELTCLLVDDDPIDLENLRRYLSDAREGPWRVMVARNGREAVEIARAERPDLVFLDYRLPDRSGSEVLRELRIHWRDEPPTLVSVTGAGSETVVREMLLMGACDYVRKEFLSGAVVARFLREARRIAAARPKAPDAEVLPVATKPGRVVALVGSAGATAPLLRLLDVLGPCPDAALIVALHLPTTGNMQLENLVQLHTRLPVAMAAADSAPVAGGVCLCPPGFDVGIENGRFVLIEAIHLTSVPSLDVLLTTLAREYGERVLTVVLSGLGRDGARGATAVAAAGGLVLALDPATTEFPSMIDAARATGVVAEVADADGLAARVGAWACGARDGT